MPIAPATATAEADQAAGWATLAGALTPVERAGPLWLKREDRFAPLGEGGINGSKLRQCVWLVAHDAAGRVPGVLSAASLLSPQLATASWVARHFGLDTAHVVGATRPGTAVNHPSVAAALHAGARFFIAKVGYNPALQAAAARLTRPGAPCHGWYTLRYGISLEDEPRPARAEAFHRGTALQVENLPEPVTTLVLAAGSCNTAASVLYGLALHRPRSLKRVLLVGIGPSRRDWLDRRLAAIDAAAPVPVSPCFRRTAGWPDAADPGPHAAPYELRYADLHAAGRADYHARQPFRLEGVDFHPTYEGKVLHALFQPRPPIPPGLVRPDTLVWVVGSTVSWPPMAHAAAAVFPPRVGSFETLP